jgi:hypothetical protein
LHKSDRIGYKLKAKQGAGIERACFSDFGGKPFTLPLWRLSFGNLWSWNRDCPSLSFAAPTPGHLFQRFEKINKFSIRKRTEGPSVIGANKAPAIRNQAVHRFSDGRMMVSAGINAIVFGETGNVRDFWCIWGHTVAPDYTPNQGAI